MIDANKNSYQLISLFKSSIRINFLCLIVFTSNTIPKAKEATITKKKHKMIITKMIVIQLVSCELETLSPFARKKSPRINATEAIIIMGLYFTIAQIETK